MWKLLTCKLLAVGAVAGIAMISAPQPAHAGCHINLKVANESTTEVQVLSTLSKVRTKNGTWRKLTKGGWYVGNGWIKKNRTSTDVYKAALKCGKNRQYRIAYICKIQGPKHYSKVRYFPSSSSYSKSDMVIVPLTC